MRHKIKGALLLALAVLGIASCSEQTPDEFEPISGVYFNNRTNTNILQDSTDVTFVYQKGDEMVVPIKIQLVGRPADKARQLALSVSSLDAKEGIDYVLPEKAELPAGETTLTYNVTLKRTAALKSVKKELRFELHANDEFTLPVAWEVTSANDTITTLSYRIIFSDQFTTAPKAWEDDLLGAFTQQKFELACKVLDIDPADFNDDTKMTLAIQSYVCSEMTLYVREQQTLRYAGEPYDEDAFDANGNPLSFGY